MDIIWIIIGATLILIGIIGSILPALPGTPIAYAGLLALKLHSTASSQLTNSILLWLAFFVIIITILDYYLPIWGTQKFGGSKWGKWGSTIGLILGVFTPVFGPLSFLIGPFLGAFIGEIAAGNNKEMALKSAWGSFIGFIGGTLGKVLMCLVLLFFFIKVLI
ncbi:MAG: DUF456 domain-containing protein [Bacteroidia bacterium]|jgi:uncharacterized protein YqgC (DUF456 family)|nr:DUF456 domain-containing protein [Bacteroidia bacterium]